MNKRYFTDYERCYKTMLNELYGHSSVDDTFTTIDGIPSTYFFSFRKL